MDALFHDQPHRAARFQPDKMGKATLWTGRQMMVGLNAFEPGQEHAVHAHQGMDKLYHVLEGEGEFEVAGETRVVRAGGLVVAPEGVAHGVRNTGTARLVVLAVLAPAPA